ncbi:Coatomer subunit zeta-1 [Thelohanellus kitauei]|uniref:Coatomer subunit zeta n=1 Tax=Thelohanellus kitauei TaxID=669202 RepID=A0A0C2J1X6_THEKT|nr:Coatomer subunit zeta-1 [Thelohanellus kitauei]
MDSIIPIPTLFSVQAVIFLDAGGERIYAKYYGKNFREKENRENFEKKLQGSASQENSGTMMIETYCVIYQIISDIFLYVVGNYNENQVCSVITDPFEQCVSDPSERS